MNKKKLVLINSKQYQTFFSMKLKLSCFVVFLIVFNVSGKGNNLHTKLSPKVFNEAFSFQQQKEITGNVTDNEGIPLPGVSILIKNTAIGTVTDSDGNFTLKVPSGTQTLQFSFIGMQTLEVALREKTSFNIVMNEATIGLEEVVAVGYGTMKRQDLTGSVSSFRMENSPASLMPNVNALEALKGNIAGIEIGAVNQAGGDANILIRGQSSLRGSNSPLIVVDGVIFSGAITDINKNDIEKIDVLKDAVSSAAYGSRSANGVIAITTKKGRTSKPTITFNASTAFQLWQNRPNLLTPDQWIEKVNDVLKHPVGSTFWMLPQVEKNYLAGNSTDWLQKSSRTGSIRNYQLGVSGRTEMVNYYLSASYDSEKGIIIGNDFNRVSVMAKLNTDITNWLQIGADFSFSKRDYSGVEANLSRAYTMEPYGQYYRDDKGNLEKYPREQGSEFIHPLWGVSDGLIDDFDERNSYRLLSYALLTAPFVEGLTLRINYQNSLNDREARRFTHPGYFVSEGAVSNILRYETSTITNYLSNSSGSFNIYNNKEYVLDNILNYRKTFNKHDIDATFVATRDKSRNETKTLTGSNFAAIGNSNLSYWGLHLAETQKLNLGVIERSNIGYLGRLSYSYENKYFFTGLYRRDGASVFGVDKKWGNFSAVGLAYAISNEDFLKNFEPLDYLKLKLSWGQNGNQGVSPYTTLAKVNIGSPSGFRYEFSDKARRIFYGMNQLNLANSSLGWESTEKWNGGFESVWLNNRLFIDLDLYLSNTTDQIYSPPIPSMTGFTSITSSLGEVANNGIEIDVKTINIQNKNWYWDTNVTFSLNRNKLIRLTGQDLDGDGIEDDNIAAGMFIGQPINAIYGYVFDGIIQENDVKYKAMEGAANIDGYPKYKDLNNDGKISTEDRKILGYTQPNFNLNMSNTLSYKNIEFYCMLIGFFGGNNYYMKSNPGAFQQTGGYNMQTIYKPYWKPDRPSSIYPAAFFTGDGKFLGLQSRTFIRVQNLSLSYTFNQEWVRQSNIRSFKVFLTANNPIIFTKWAGGDPEVGTTVHAGTFPVSSTYSFGLNLTF